MLIGELAGYFASILASLTFMPQVIKNIRTQESRSLSATMLTLCFLGNVGWLVNGLVYNNLPLVLSAVLIMFLMTPLFYIKAKNNELFDLRKAQRKLSFLFLSMKTDP